MKQIVFLISEMNMGGAERIISLLANCCAELNWNTTVIITHQSLNNANLSRLNKTVKVISLMDELTNEKTHNYPAAIHMCVARIEGKLGQIFGYSFNDKASIQKFYSRNYDKIWWLKRYFLKNSNATLVSFLYVSIFLTLLSATKKNKIIISERGAPQQSVGSRTDMAFFRQLFSQADHVVFQSPSVQKWYKDNIGLEGTVIFNPIKEGLPQSHGGERKKRIVNFCRIDPQKNLHLLLKSFEKISKEYVDYELHIYGDVDEHAKEYAKQFLEDVKESDVSKKIKIFPACSDIHEKILDYAMFVSTSNYEGMSNSMLEAMAIGLPTICTDCPAGGARAVISDHENGLLVPVNDVNALYSAMKELISNQDLAEKLSENGKKIKENQSSEKILQQWIEIF